MRLIDADALIKEYPQASGLKLVIENAPTAYDVEKVVAELEKLPNREADYYYANSNDVIDREDAIDIVRKGGAE